VSAYEDAPLMIATGLIGVYFGVLGLRAILADRRERWRGRETAPPAREDREVACRVSGER
jgi:hypothetical protein